VHGVHSFHANVLILEQMEKAFGIHMGAVNFVSSSFTSSASSHLHHFPLVPVTLISFSKEHAVACWLMHCATSRNVAGSGPEILPAALGIGVYSASNRNEYQKQTNIISRE
jgi:hypothetical protein